MARPLRITIGGWVYHVLNRANSRTRIFHDDEDYLAFECVLTTARERIGMRILAYCIMPNHWHMVLWPASDGQLSEFVAWVSSIHANRWHGRRGSLGAGHLYQGRFKSVPVQNDAHLLAVCRYVERNPLRAGLVERAEHWRYGSLWRRQCGDERDRSLLSDWPIAMPENWVDLVNQPQTQAELKAIRHAVARGHPIGDEPWRGRAIERLRLASTARPRGRPRKDSLPGAGGAAKE